jgi:hypothetical protein
VFGAERMSTLLPTVRRKLEVVLRDWAPPSARALEVLSPWKSVPAMATLFSRCILPKLADTVGKLPIDPSNQEMQPIRDLLDWRGASVVCARRHCVHTRRAFTAPARDVRSLCPPVTCACCRRAAPGVPCRRA